ncbi:alkaline phosphatase D family protein [Imtechella halotolerans]|uniref:Alkaline phosphatase n=1 Tax=Imtechella halotolerans K1 TaxID=946077 RepID=I0W7M4_9FLAO|nr:alkaline phosphatase D family protein [Imtechella halotolerans]EID72390.1 alkaline phosphatase [Imtechella halotolerans K1]WMQ64491.1 alkaline phosphatase D family protein [Imtechella halotolerans]
MIKQLAALTVLLITTQSCVTKAVSNKEVFVNKADEALIAFGSCNMQNRINPLWDDVLNVKPAVWIWGGDNIYSDTDDMNRLKADYQQQLNQKGYAELVQNVPIMGTWDDHDYGLNDGGIEFHAKQGSQQLFLDFIGVPQEDVRRKQEGVYHAETLQFKKGSVKIIVLDTRYFRTELTPSEVKGKRFQPNTYGQGSMLGDAQWKWLELELKKSKADFNLIVSSVQILSAEHGFETWGNMPHEVDKLKALIVDSKAKGVILLSGDRHISEFSKTTVSGLEYPLIDFTSSGLTHTYESYSGESNRYRVGEVINSKSFGVLRFDFKDRLVHMEMIGDGGLVLQEFKQTY